MQKVYQIVMRKWSATLKFQIAVIIPVGILSEQIHISVSAQHMINKQMVSHQLFCALSGCCRLYLPSSHYIIRYFNENIHGSIASTSIVHR